jgi:hypothetical protein
MQISATYKFGMPPKTDTDSGALTHEPRLARPHIDVRALASMFLSVPYAPETYRLSRTHQTTGSRMLRGSKQNPSFTTWFAGTRENDGEDYSYMPSPSGLAALLRQCGVPDSAMPSKALLSLWVSKAKRRSVPSPSYYLSPGLLAPAAGPQPTVPQPELATDDSADEPPPKRRKARSPSPPTERQLQEPQPQDSRPHQSQPQEARLLESQPQEPRPQPPTLADSQQPQPAPAPKMCPTCNKHAADKTFPCLSPYCLNAVMLCEAISQHGFCFGCAAALLSHKRKVV